MKRAQVQKILFCPDTHAPYHSKKAWELLMKVGRAWKPDIICHIGDLADFYAVSSYSKDPSRRFRLADELTVVNSLLDDLDSLKAKRKIFCHGNHEFRMDRYLQDKAPELLGMLSVEEFLDLEARGWEQVRYREFGKIGKLHVTHDVATAGRYAAHRALDTFQGNVVTGHTHRLGMVVEGNAKGERMVSAQFGWLGDVRYVDYMTRIAALRNWSLGFGVGYLEEKTKNVYLGAVPVIRNSCALEGVVYSV